jgi:dephospho-CoA kinase
MDGEQLLRVLSSARLVDITGEEVAFRCKWLPAYWLGQPPADPAAPRPGGHWGQKVVLGLTGNIAMGKSSVLAMLASLDAEVIDADGLVHRLREPGTPGYNRLVALFGSTMLRLDGRIDSARLAAAAFEDKTVLAQLEQIFRPLVVGEVERMGRASNRRVVVVEAIKLLEGRLKDQVDSVWVVDAPREQQIERLIRTRSLTREQAVARIEAQNPQADKLAQADVIIHNAGDLSAVWWQVLEAWAGVLHQLALAGWLDAEPVGAFVASSLRCADASAHVEAAMAGLKSLAERIYPGGAITSAQAAEILGGIGQ